MQKSTLLISSLCALAIMGVGLSSCKDDDDPVVPPKLSISTETVTVGEGGGSTAVELVLDRAAATDLTVEYDLGGTATSPADYTITGTEGEVTIPAGQLTASIQIAIVNDAIYEGDETIEISITDVDNPDVVITNDDEAVVTITEDDQQISASFEVTTLEVSESDGILQINVALSQDAPANVTLKYQLSGSARDSVTAKAADPDLPADYAIRGGSPGQLQIAAGQKTGVIRLGLYSDFVIEDGDQETDPWDPETIIITLTEASAGVQINAEKDEMQIALNQQDGKIVALFWDVDNEDTTVDMDLFLWIGDIGDDVTELGLVSLSAFEGTDGPEVVFIPETLTEVKYGLSYTYYSGDITPMEFESHFIDFADGALGDREIYTGTYTLDNINEWETLDDIIHIEQTFEVDENGEYVNISTISTPTEGSRVPTIKLPSGTKKSVGERIQSFKKFK